MDTIHVLGVTHPQLREGIEREICASGHAAHFGPPADSSECRAVVLVDSAASVSAGEIRALDEHPEIPKIVITDDPGDQRSLELLAEGADDVMLDTELGRFAVSLERATRMALMRASSDRNQELFRAVTDHMPIEMLLKDLDGRFVYANRAMATRARLSNTEIIGRTAAELFEPAIARDIETHDRQVIESGQGSDRQATVNQRHLHVVKFPLYDADGAISGLGTLLVDISEQHEILEALRRSESRMADFVDCAADMFWETDAEHRFTSYSGRFSEVMGMESESILHTSAPLIFEEDRRQYPEKWRQHRERINAQRAFSDMEHEWTRPDGKRVVLRTSGKPVYDDDGKFFGYRGTTVDVTHLKGVELALRESEERFRNWIETISDIITVLDHDGIIRYQSPSMLTVLGYDADELIGTHPLERIHPDDHGPVSEAMIGLLGEPGTASRRHRFRHKNGEWRTMDATGRSVRTASGTMEIVVNSRDVTQQVAIEQALSESEQLLRTMMDNSPVEMFIKDREGRFLYMNPYSQKLLEIDKEQVLGRTSEQIWPEVPQLVVGHDRQVIASESVIVNEEAVSTSNGMQHVLMYKFPIYDAAGKVSGLAGVGINITGRVHAEIALRDEMQRNQAVLDSTIDGYFLTNTDGEILIANSAYASMVGFERDQLIGMYISDFEAIGKPEEIPGHLARIVREGRDSFETRLFHKDGHLVDCEVSATSVRLKDDDYVFSFMRDVSERNRVIESLRNSESRYQSLAQLVPVGIFRTDPDGKATFVNDQWCELTGVSLDAAFDGAWVDAVHDDDRERVRQSWDECIRQHGVYRDEYRYLRSPTSLVWVFCQANPEFDKAGNFNGYVGTVTNISARKQAEQSLENYRDQLEDLVEARTAELRAAVREQESFSYSVSHDLRAPLRTIDGFSHMLLDEYGDELDSTARDYLLRVRTASQRMGVLIDALLDLSRMSRRKMHYEDVDLSTLSREILRKLKTNDPDRTTEFKVADGLVVNGDSELLRVVLENLIGNAWKYTSKQAQTCIEIGCQSSDDAAYFVRDNGVGFDMKYVDKLFGPFQRLHNVDEYDGTGIGLATVARIIDRHGGRVWAEGAPDGGATFYFTT